MTGFLDYALSLDSGDKLSFQQTRTGLSIQVWKPTGKNGGGWLLSEAKLLSTVRHTFATLLIQNGESLAYVKEQLGHHSIQITVDTYGHLVPGGNRQAVDRLDDPQEPTSYPTIRNLSATTPLDAVLPNRVSARKVK